jgi:hypothetical protein
VQSIGNISFGLGATGGSSDDGGGGKRRRASESRCVALGSQWRGRRASRGREGADRGVVVVRMGLEWAAHGEQEAAAELVLAGAVEDEARMREDEIDQAGEHQWITVVLW